MSHVNWLAQLIMKSNTPLLSLPTWSYKLIMASYVTEQILELSNICVHAVNLPRHYLFFGMAMMQWHVITAHPVWGKFSTVNLCNFYFYAFDGFLYVHVVGCTRRNLVVFLLSSIVPFRKYCASVWITVTGNTTRDGFNYLNTVTVTIVNS